MKPRRKTWASAAALACSLWLGGPAQAKPFDPWTQAARYRIELTIDLGAAGLEGREAVRLWIPAPAGALSAQRVEKRAVDSPWPHRWTTDSLGNTYAYFERRAAGDAHRPAEQTSPRGDPRAGATLRCTWWVARAPRPAGAAAPPDGSAARFLQANRLIPLDLAMRALSKKVLRGADGAAEKAGRAYDHVYRTMTYKKVGTGWGLGDASWACRSGYGNCTDFHSVWIGLLRAGGVPARFRIGFEIPTGTSTGELRGYHCWAEFLEPDRGWRPVDVSEAKKAKRERAFFGALPSDRIAFTTGRDLVLAPPQAGPPRNFVVYPYAEIGGKAIERVPATLRFQRLTP